MNAETTVKDYIISSDYYTGPGRACFFIVLSGHERGVEYD